MIGIVETVFLMAFVYWMWPDLFSQGASRLNKMVDVVANRFFDAFNKIAPKENGPTESRTTMSNLRRYASDQKRNRQSSREFDAKARDAQLFNIKENIPNIVETPARPLMGYCCFNCAPTSRETLVNNTTKYLGLKNILTEYPLIKRSNFWETYFPCLAQLGQYQSKFVDFPRNLLNDPRIKNAIEKTAIEQFQDSDNCEDEYYNQLYDACKKRAQKILADMRGYPRLICFKFASWLIFKLFPRFLTSVTVHTGQLEMIKEAQRSGLPVIFISLHRSHVDYGAIPFACLNYGIQVPVACSGDNLNVPVIGTFLRTLGAFFIKRRIDPVMGRRDHIYKSVLHTYLNSALKTGHNVVFFLEGGRTRTGKPLTPKYGIFSIIIDSLMSGAVEDALIVPISINYDKLVEGNFISEQLGEPKRMESFGYILKSIWKTLNKKCGHTRLQFNQPFSLREMIKSSTVSEQSNNNVKEKKLLSHTSTTSLYGTEVVSTENKQIVERISKHILFECAESTVIMSTNLVAFLLMYKFRNGATMEQLASAMDLLRKELNLANRDVGFSGDSLDVIQYAIDLLGPALIKKEKVNQQEIIKAITSLPNVIELSYYSNTMVTCYALPSVIALAIYWLNNKSKLLYFDDILETSKELCDILQYEFLFCKPCEELENILMNGIEDIQVKEGILNPLNVQENYSFRRLADEIEGIEEESTGLRYMLNSGENDRLDYWKGIVSPIIEAYSVTAFTLRKLVQRTLLENELIQEVIAEMRLQIESGEIRYEESVSSDSIRNALKLFQKWEFIECHTENKLKLYHMHDSHDNDESVDSLCNRIDRFRENYTRCDLK